MTVAAVITMAVSLSALAGVLIMRQAINKAAIQWKGGVEVAIFLKSDVTRQESLAIGHELATTQGVKKYRYVNQTQAYQEFKTMFANEPDLVNVLTVKDMPPSYRVVPVRAQDVANIGRQFESQPGVEQVAYAQQEIDALLQHFHALRSIALVIAIGVMVGAVALIVNTIQLAIFARRREVAVMKLVGATNWFIRVPFMLEGLVHGIVGAVLAFLLSYFTRNTIAQFIGNDPLLGGKQLFVTSHEALVTGVFILIVGAFVGAIGSAFAVRRFLSV